MTAERSWGVTLSSVCHGRESRVKAIDNVECVWPWLVTWNVIRKDYDKPAAEARNRGTASEGTVSLAHCPETMKRWCDGDDMADKQVSESDIAGHKKCTRKEQRTYRDISRISLQSVKSFIYSSGYWKDYDSRGESGVGDKCSNCWLNKLRISHLSLGGVCPIYFWTRALTHIHIKTKMHTVWRAGSPDESLLPLICNWTKNDGRPDGDKAKIAESKHSPCV